MRNPMPRQLPGKPGFVLDVTDRVTGRRSACGLGTSDEKEALLIAHSLVALLGRPDLLDHATDHTADLLAFHPKAVELALGANHPALAAMAEMRNPKVGLTQDDLAEAERLARQVLTEAIPPPAVTSDRTKALSDETTPSATFDQTFDWDGFSKAVADHYAQGLERTSRAIRANLANLLPAKLRGNRPRPRGYGPAGRSDGSG